MVIRKSKTPKKFYSKQGNLVKLRKSRGFYYCEECGNEIKPKDEYWDISGGDSYSGFHKRICKNCYKR